MYSSPKGNEFFFFFNKTNSDNLEKYIESSLNFHTATHTQRLLTEVIHNVVTTAQN